MDIYQTIIRFFQEGGFFMYPIGLVLAIGAAIAIERWLTIGRAMSLNARAARQVNKALSAGDVAAVVELAKNAKAPLLRVLGAGLARLGHAERREDVEYAMEEGVMEVMIRLEKRTPYLATLANIATLLGLLGTIIGLIAAFTAVAHADPAEKANLLSASISVAMNTTAFGLITAIPLSLIHSIMQSRTASVVDGIEMAGIRLLNLLSYQRTRAENNRT